MGTFFIALTLLVFTFVFLFFALEAKEREARGLSISVRIACYVAAGVFGVMTAFVLLFFQV